MFDADFLVRKVAAAVASAELGRSRLMPAVLGISGMTSVKIRHFLNNLCDFRGCHYLEVGTHMGATVAAASFCSLGYFATIDNFSEFDAEGLIRQRFFANLRRLSKDCCIAFHEHDCWQVAERLPAQAFNVYFYDGHHGEREQQDAIIRFSRALQNPFVLIIDDWNFPHVRSGTAAGLQHAGHRVIHDWAFRTPTNGCADTWWNGFYVAVISKNSRGT